MGTNKENKEKGSQIQIIIAIIGVIGVLGAALFANWDKIFPSKEAPQSEVTPLPVITDKENPSGKIDYQIIIDMPKNNEEVKQFTDVKFHVNGHLPNGYKPILLIRDPLGQYWSWGASITGRRKRVQIGMPEDYGKEFEIVILITDKTIPLGKPTQLLPPGFYYESVIVIRKNKLGS